MKTNLRFYGLVVSLIVSIPTVVHYAKSAHHQGSWPFSAQASLPSPQTSPPPLTLQPNLAGPETINLGMPERRVSAASR